MATFSVTPEPARGKRLVKLFAALLAVVVVAELGARLIMTRLPEPLVWPRYEVQRKVDRLDELAPMGCLDVAVFGSSVANAALDPAIMLEGTELRGFNASLGGSGSGAWTTWAREIVIPTGCPQMSIIAVSPRDLNDSTAADNSFLESYERSLGRLDRIGELSGWSRAKKWSWDNSGLFALQRAFRRPSESGAFFLDESGPWRVINDDNGVLLRFQNQAYDERPARRRFDRLVVFADYEVGGQRTRDLAELAAALQHAGSEVVFVALPFTLEETTAYVDDGGEDIEAFRATVVALAEEAEARSVDLVGIVDGREFFADDYHVNGEGAAVVSRALSETLRLVG